MANEHIPSTEWSLDDILALARKMDGCHNDSDHAKAAAALHACAKKLEHYEKRLHGPYYVVMNVDDSIHHLGKNQDSDPCIFSSVGPHDNHSKHGRRVEFVMLQLVPVAKGISHG